MVVNLILILNLEQLIL